MCFLILLVSAQVTISNVSALTIPLEIGVVGNSNTWCNTWLLDVYGNGVYGAGDLSYVYGKAGDSYVTGDWNSDGWTEIGVVRNGTSWLLDMSANGKYGSGDLDYTFGKAGDTYVTGKWS